MNELPDWREKKERKKTQHIYWGCTWSNAWLKCAVCSCPSLSFFYWFLAGGGGWPELPNMQWNGLKPTESHLHPVTKLDQLVISCKNNLASEFFGLKKNKSILMKIHSAKSKKEDQKSHFTPKGIPSCLVVEWVFPSIYFQQWMRVSKWPRIQLEAEQLHSHRVLVINYTVASGRQEETPFLRKSRESSRNEEMERKGGEAKVSSDTATTHFSDCSACDYTAWNTLRFPLLPLSLSLTGKSVVSSRCGLDQDWHMWKAQHIYTVGSSHTASLPLT